jgi:hypothetical protein
MVPSLPGYGVMERSQRFSVVDPSSQSLIGNPAHGGQQMIDAF